MTKWSKRSSEQLRGQLQDSQKPASRIKRPRKLPKPSSPGQYGVGDYVEILAHDKYGWSGATSNPVGRRGYVYSKDYNSYSVRGGPSGSADYYGIFGFDEVTAADPSAPVPATPRPRLAAASNTKTLADYMGLAMAQTLAPSLATLQAQSNQPNNQGGGMAYASSFNPYYNVSFGKGSPPSPSQPIQTNRYNIGDRVTVRTGKTVWTITDVHIEPQWSGDSIWFYRLVNDSGSINQEAEDQLRIVENAPIEKPKAVVDFDTVVIADEKRQQILEALEQINQGDLIFDTWGFGETIEKGKGVSMLFYGPPGTGKTLMAQAIASKLGKKLKVLAVADIESNVPGEAERNIRSAFQNGHDDVLLFDECDSLVYSRTNVGPLMAALVNELLSQLERFDGVTIFTTNRLGHLDEAVNRRLALKLEFDVPTHSERVEIWKRMFPRQAPLAEDIDWERLAIVEMAGGYIKNAVLRAARMAAAEKIDNIDKKIAMKHLKRAVLLEAEAMVSFTDAIEREQSYWTRSMGAQVADVNSKRIVARDKEGANG